MSTHKESSYSPYPTHRLIDGNQTSCGLTTASMVTIATRDEARVNCRRCLAAIDRSSTAGSCFDCGQPSVAVSILDDGSGPFQTVRVCRKHADARERELGAKTREVTQ